MHHFRHSRQFKNHRRVEILSYLGTTMQGRKPGLQLQVAANTSKHWINVPVVQSRLSVATSGGWTHSSRKWKQVLSVDGKGGGSGGRLLQLTLTAVANLLVASMAASVMMHFLRDSIADIDWIDWVLNIEILSIAEIDQIDWMLIWRVTTKQWARHKEFRTVASLFMSVINLIVLYTNYVSTYLS